MYNCRNKDEQKKKHRQKDKPTKRHTVAYIHTYRDKGTNTVCPVSSEPFYIVTYNIKRVLLGHTVDTQSWKK